MAEECDDMCAIAGCIGLKLKECTAEKMLKTMDRRGPDGRGVQYLPGCVLLHTRLAVIDPAGGRQPMELEWGGEKYSLVYNGETYNTDELQQELRKLGHSFETHCDTEVVLHAYAQWGREALSKINGIFAMAVWEHKARRLFLARDRMGVKPLFYSLIDGGMLFASEIKTILAYPESRAVLTQEGAAQLLLLGPGRKPGSGVFDGVSELEPGCCAYFEAGKLHVERYWFLKDREHRESFAETVEHTRYLVLNAIKRQMISDVPIGTFLSGGLDSSIISAVCAEELRAQGIKLNTFSVGYPDQDLYFRPGKFQPSLDSHYIEQMVHYLDTEQHLTELGPETLVDALEEATIARDLPGMADVDFSLLAFCKMISNHVKVALSGECADELFGGYPWYRDPEVRARTGFPWAQNTEDRASILSPEMRQGLDCMEYVTEAYERTCRESDILPENSPLERCMKEMVNLNLRWFMQTLLDRKDRMSMFSGLEVRVPFCDHRIAEYLYNVKWEYKDYLGREKGLLREAMRDWLPEEVLWRKKSPYPKTHNPNFLDAVTNKLRRILDEDGELLTQLVKREELEKLLRHEDHVQWYGQLMNLPQTIAFFIQLDHWLKKFSIKLT